MYAQKASLSMTYSSQIAVYLLSISRNVGLTCNDGRSNFCSRKMEKDREIRYEDPCSLDQPRSISLLTQLMSACMLYINFIKQLYQD
jgi:hypothetical protein